LYEGDVPTTAANAVLTEKSGRAWTTTGQAIAITSVWAKDDNTVTHLGVVTATGNDSGKKYFEENFRLDWIYDPSRAISLGKTVQLTSSQIFVKEMVYQHDLNGDEVIGDSIALVIDEIDGTDSYGLYQMTSGMFSVSAPRLAVRQSSGEFIPLMADSRGRLWSTKSVPLALNLQTNLKTGRDELVVVSMSGSTEKQAYSEEVFTVSNDGAKAILSGKPVKLTALQVLTKELTFGQDLNGDDIVGEAIVSVLDDSDAVAEAGLYKMASGGYVVSSANLGEGHVPEAFGLLVTGAKGVAWTTKATKVSINKQLDKKGNQSLSLLTVIGEGAKAVYAEEFFCLVQTVRNLYQRVKQ
jgi:hypothetical protein